MARHLPFLTFFFASLLFLPRYGLGQCDNTFTALDDLCIDAGVQTGLSGGSPSGGTYSGPGVTDNGDGTYSFDPTSATAGTHTLSYTTSDGWQQFGNSIGGTQPFGLFGVGVSSSADGNRVAIGGASFGTPGVVRIYEWNGTAWSQLGSDITGEGAMDEAGTVSLSDDGTRVAIGALRNGSAVGHVRVFEWSGTAWNQLGADIDGNPNITGGLGVFGGGGSFGRSVSLSEDGTYLAVGGNAENNGTVPGYARILEWTGTTWSQVGTDIIGEAVADFFGTSISISDDGTIVAIGAPNAPNASNVLSGDVKVYQWSGSAWSQLGSDLDGDAAGDIFGASISLSADGTRLVAGTSSNFGQGGDYVRVYELSGTTWNQMSTDIVGAATDDYFGYSVSISADGTYLAIGGPFNDAGGTPGLNTAGHVQVYRWNGTTWIQVGADIFGEMGGDRSGEAVAISGGGERVFIGSPFNSADIFTAQSEGQVRVFSFVDGCSVTDDVTVFAVPTVPAPTITEATCDAPGQIQFAALGTGEAYFISMDGGFIFNELVGSTIALPQGPADAISYQVKVVNSAAGCESLVETINIAEINGCPICEVFLVEHPANAFVCEGDESVTFSALAGGTGSFTYLWETSTTGFSWTPAGSTGPNLTIPGPITLSNNGRLYRVTVTADFDTPGDPSDDCTIVSADARLSVESVQDPSFFVNVPDLCPDAPIQENIQGFPFPSGGVFSGPGITDNADGTFDFDPGDAGSGNHTLTYTLTDPATWEQLGNPVFGNNAGLFGFANDISHTGHRVVIGAFRSNSDLGNVFVYRWTGTSWSQLGNTLQGTFFGELFGASVVMTPNGDRIGAASLGASATGGQPLRDGKVRIFDYNVGFNNWSQFGPTIFPTGGKVSVGFGEGLAISAGGNRVAVGNGVFGDYVEVFDWDGSAWVKVGADILGDNTGDAFGSTVSLSADGKYLAVGATNASSSAGYAKIYQEVGGVWTQLGSNLNGDAASDFFGDHVDLSADGMRVAVKGTSYVRVFDWNGSAWVQAGSDVTTALPSKATLNDAGDRLVATFNDGNGRLNKIYDWDGSDWINTDDIDFVGVTAVSGQGDRVLISNTISFSPANSSTFRVYEQEALCEKTATQELTVLTAPPVPQPNVIPASCQSPGEITFLGSLGTDEAYFVSVDGGINFQELTTASIPIPQGPLDGGTFYIKTVNTVTECGSEAVSVTIDPLECNDCPILTNITTSFRICEGDPGVVLEVGSNNAAFDIQFIRFDDPVTDPYTATGGTVVGSSKTPSGSPLSVSSDPVSGLTAGVYYVLHCWIHKMETIPIQPVNLLFSK